MRVAIARRSCPTFVGNGPLAVVVLFCLGLLGVGCSGGSPTTTASPPPGQSTSTGSNLLGSSQPTNSPATTNATVAPNTTVAPIITVAPVTTIATTNTTVTRTPSAVPADIERLLLVKLPTGYSQAPDSKGDTGPSDLAKATHDEGGSDSARRGLIADGFEAGYQRMWVSADGGAIVAIVYKFHTATGAAEHQRRTLVVLSDPTAAQSTPFDVSGVPGAVGMAAVSQGIPTRNILFTEGSYGVNLVAVGTSTSDAFASRLAADQYQILLQASVKITK